MTDDLTESTDISLLFIEKKNRNELERNEENALIKYQKKYIPFLIIFSSSKTFLN